MTNMISQRWLSHQLEHQKMLSPLWTNFCIGSREKCLSKHWFDFKTFYSFHFVATFSPSQPGKSQLNYNEKMFNESDNCLMIRANKCQAVNCELKQATIESAEEKTDKTSIVSAIRGIHGTVNNSQSEPHSPHFLVRATSKSSFFPNSTYFRPNSKFKRKKIR